MFLVACEGRKEESYEGKVVVIEVGENLWRMRRASSS